MMKIIVAEGLQNCVVLINEAVFEELTKAGMMDAADVEETGKEKVGRIVQKILENNIVALPYGSSAIEGKKKRSQADKVGKFRCLNSKVAGLKADVRELKKMVRMVTNSLSPFMDVDRESLERIVCKDEVDLALLDLLRAKGGLGTTPNEAIREDELKRYRLKPFHITRRIQRMNRRLKEALDRDLAVSVDRRWKLSLFARKMLADDVEEPDE